MSDVYPKYQYFPSTSPAPSFAHRIAEVFLQHRSNIDTVKLKKGLTSNDVLAVLRPDLIDLGFSVEASKLDSDKLQRPVYFGLQGSPTLRYQIDAYHPEWRCGLEVEAGRAWMGNAVYRDLVQAMVMVDVDVLVLAVPIAYKFNSSGKLTTSNDFENTRSLVSAVFGHSRVRIPYGLLLVGY
jgi:hypothetical protein